MAARFAYLPIASGRGDAALMPVVPLQLRFKDNEPMQVHGLLDSGATVNVLPYGLGVRLGAVWEAQTTRVTLAGNLAAQEARALLVEAQVSNFPLVSLVFACTRSENVPLLLGQVNFFEEFDVCFHRSRRQFEIEPARR
ncbi:MAG: retroviral-like aspartic protease [Verrucomicrobia bacterium]|nr:retroviral-like aspartic protease [Verrucomicrobiota bacterium]